MAISSNSIEADLSASLLLWWDRHGRTRLPWKLLPGGFRPAPHQQLDPYPIWIAEVMLQQTQLSVVLPYWRRWMAAFPTVDSLAVASLDDVRLQWQGLGYYARARRLHEAAQLLIGQSWPVLCRRGWFRELVELLLAAFSPAHSINDTRFWMGMSSVFWHD